MSSVLRVGLEWERDRIVQPNNDLTWIPHGLKLEFVVREQRPRTLRELLETKNRAWRTLFLAWLRAAPRGSESPDVIAAFKEADRARGTSTPKEIVQAIPGGAVVWNGRVDRFRTDCDGIRAQVRQDRRLTRDMLGSRATGQAVTRGAAHRTAASLASRRLADPQRALEGIAEFEAVLIRQTRVVKPKFAQLLQLATEAKWPKGSKATQLLEDAWILTSTAEATLRATCAEARLPPNLKGAPPSPSQLATMELAMKQLPEAWANYVDAYRGLDSAILVACKDYAKGVEKATGEMIANNFSTVFPVLSASLLCIETMIAGLALLITALGVVGGIGTANPVVLAIAEGLSTALATTYIAIEELIKSSVSKAAAKDRRRQREHVGRQYRQNEDNVLGPRSGEATAEAAKWTTRLAGVAGPGLKGVGGESPAVGAEALKGVPFTGHAARLAALGVKFHKQFNPAVLQDEAQRAALLKMLDTAYRSLDRQVRAADDFETVVFSVDAQGARVKIAGVMGTLTYGGFSPDDRQPSFADAFAHWKKDSAPQNALVPTVLPRGHDIFTGKFGWYLLLCANTGKPPKNFDGILEDGALESPFQENAEGFFECVALGTPTSGGGVTVRSDVSSLWRLRISLSADGAALLLQPPEFVELARTLPSGDVLRTTDAALAAELLRDETVERFRKLKNAAPGTPRGTFDIDSSGVRDTWQNTNLGSWPVSWSGDERTTAIANGHAAMWQSGQFSDHVKAARDLLEGIPGDKAPLPQTADRLDAIEKKTRALTRALGKPKPDNDDWVAPLCLEAVAWRDTLVGEFGRILQFLGDWIESYIATGKPSQGVLNALGELGAAHGCVLEAVRSIDGIPKIPAIIEGQGNPWTPGSAPDRDRLDALWGTAKSTQDIWWRQALQMSGSAVSSGEQFVTCVRAAVTGLAPWDISALPRPDAELDLIDRMNARLKEAFPVDAGDDEQVGSGCFEAVTWRETFVGQGCWALKCLEDWLLSAVRTAPPDPRPARTALSEVLGNLATAHDNIVGGVASINGIPHIEAILNDFGYGTPDSPLDPDLQNRLDILKETVTELSDSPGQ
jgi:hypothetical protein